MGIRREAAPGRKGAGSAEVRPRSEASPWALGRAPQGASRLQRGLWAAGPSPCLSTALLSHFPEENNGLVEGPSAPVCGYSAAPSHSLPPLSGGAGACSSELPFGWRHAGTDVSRAVVRVPVNAEEDSSVGTSTDACTPWPRKQVAHSHSHSVPAMGWGGAAFLFFLTSSWHTPGHLIFAS